MYGIYTAADANFFAGVVASLDSLRGSGYDGPLAVIDTGLDPWMRDYFAGYPGVRTLSLDPIRRYVRFTDVNSDERPVDRGWAYKAFAIVHYECFDPFTFIDGDFYPMCNLQAELEPLIQSEHVVCTEDGWNNWGPEHEEATGVKPGQHMNVNAGFLSFNLHHHKSVLWEWRDLMTRRKPFDLWYGDQGAINAIMDKHNTPKRLLNKVLWNQTHLNTQMAQDDAVETTPGNDLRLASTGERIYAWHGTGWHKLWHCIGIDHYRNDSDERQRFHLECSGRVPLPVIDHFRRSLFRGDFNRQLIQSGPLLSL